MNILQQLKESAKNFTILYVEDNPVLRNKAAKLLSKFFEHVDQAEDGKIGLEKFKKNHYPIIITDIKMPNLNGLNLAKQIKHINPDTKIIIMSAFDDKDLLLQGIEIGVFRFLTKPVEINELSEVLLEAIISIKHERKTKLFHQHLQNVFHYQSSMIVMFNDKTPVMANQIFLEFFNIEDIKIFNKYYKDLCSLFLREDGFLYESSNNKCFETLQSNEKKLFQIKLKDHNKEIKHFLLKYQTIPEKENYGILSFDDITQLNLSDYFHSSKNEKQSNKEDTSVPFDLLKAIYRNNAKMEAYNFYKGLNITNDASIAHINNQSITIKTSYTQQKAIQHEMKTLLYSEAFLHVIESTKISNISFETQTVTLEDLHFVKTSAIDRKTVRVEPEENYSAEISLKEHTFKNEITIQDISLNSVKLRLQTLPAGLEKDSEVILTLNLFIDKKPFSIKIDAIIFKKIELENYFEIIFLFTQAKKSILIKYITKRQMAIIREFKGLQNV